jgi:hypothetical protein
MSSLDVSVASSPASSQLSQSPPMSPGFVLAGEIRVRQQSNSNGSDWASVASSQLRRHGEGHGVKRRILSESSGEKNSKNEKNRENGKSERNEKDKLKPSSSNNSDHNHSRHRHNHPQQQLAKKRSSSLSIDRSNETVKNSNEEIEQDEPKQKETLTKVSTDVFQIQAQARLVELFPLADPVNVTPSHLVPVRKDDVSEYASECSAAQLDLMEKIHRSALDQITAIRMERTRQSTMDEIAEMLQRGIPIVATNRKRTSEQQVGI